MKSTTDIASAHGAKTVSAGHLRASIMGNEKFDFLKDVVEGVPDLPPPEAGAGIAADAAAGGKIVRSGQGRTLQRLVLSGWVAWMMTVMMKNRSPKLLVTVKLPEPAAIQLWRLLRALWVKALDRLHHFKEL